ncbi:MAG: amino-acid N-acetyltransferase, partial [Spirochaetales bacterium]
EILDRYNIETGRYRGVRIANAEAIPFIKMAAFDAANRIMTLLSGHRVNAVIGNWVRARSLGVIDGVDYGEAGAVDRIHVDLLQGVINQGSLPILPCVGWSASGRPYNISSRELATDLSTALGVSKLFFVGELGAITTDHYTVDSGMEATPTGRISRLNIDQAERFLALNGHHDDQAQGDTGLELVGLGFKAARGGVERVHIVDGRNEGVILQELFSNLGVGTMVHADQYQSIRGMTRRDVADVYRLMQPLVARGILVNRTEEELHESHDDFVVFETDKMIHGCGALHFYDDHQGEIAGIAVDEKYERYGIGQRIVRFLIEAARRAGLRQVFVLTTQTSDWFEQLGFVPGNLSEVPEAKRQRYDHNRKSRILFVDLDTRFDDGTQG